MKVKAVHVAAVLGVILVCASFTGLLLSIVSEGAPSADVVEPLPDIVLQSASEAEKRASLIAEANGMLDVVPKPFRGDTLMLANCQVAKERLDREYGKTDAPPLVLGACLVQGPHGKYLFLYVFNSNREIQRFIFKGQTSDGTAFHLVYHHARDAKDDSLVVWAGPRVEQVTLDEILRSPRVLRSMQCPSYTEIHMQDDAAPLLLPNAVDLVVTVEDRMAGTGNFVEVMDRTQTNRGAVSRSRCAVKGLLFPQ